MKIVNVFAVYGDFPNGGGRSLIGIFDSLGQARKIAKGRGSLDCGGDGYVEEKKAVQDGDNFYLVQSVPVALNKELVSNPRKSR